MIKGLTPYQIIEKKTHESKKERKNERCEVYWKKVSMMASQPSCQKIHPSVCLKERLFIRAIQAQLRKNHKRLGKETHRFCNILDSQDAKIQ